MNRIVYLFELDSIIRYESLENPTAISETPGFRALFDEIVKNGNCVAVSLNQLTDSQFFSQVIQNDFSYPILLNLFQEGALRVNLYGKIRTASQYVQNAIDKCLRENDDSFKFSNIPISYHERELLQIMLDSLKYSDLSVLQEKRDSSTGEEQQRYEYIRRYVNMLLNISSLETSNIPPKINPSKNFEYFINKALEILSSYAFAEEDFNSKIRLAIREVNERSAQIIGEERRNRSNWLYYKNGEQAVSSTAAAIINLCYNYTNEYSVNGATKHYDDADFENSFKADFLNRLDLYRTQSQAEPNKMISRRKWRMLLRFARYRKKEESPCNETYEASFKGDARVWKTRVFLNTIISCGWTLLYTLVFVAVEFFIGNLEGSMSASIGDSIFSSVISIFFVGLVGSVADTVLQKIFKKDSMPDLLECVSNLFLYVHDFVCILVGGKNESYKCD